MTEIVSYAQGESVLGSFVAAMSPRGVVMLKFGTVGPAMLDTLRARVAEAVLAPDAQAVPVAALAAAIDNPEVAPDLPLDLRGSDFEQRVWAALRAIPAGHTTSYGVLAASLGAPGMAREVGEACAANGIAVLVPCHRVLRKDGGIAGYRWGVRRKRALLAREAAAAA